MIYFIENTKATDTRICEIGLAKGDTSVFLLEHLRTTQDERTLLLVDTFQGFTQSSLEHEVTYRGKNLKNIDKFKYGDKGIFDRNLNKLGYRNFLTVQSDCSLVKWEEFGPLAAVLLDVDLYEPTIRTLHKLWPCIVPGGGIVVDDVASGGDWDGAYQAYIEFTQEKGLGIEVVGRKGGVLRKG
jgi:hypothetical protein